MSSQEDRVTQTLACVVGARPNFVKMGPILAGLAQVAPALKAILIHTGQHYDAVMSDLFFQQLGLPTPDVHLEVGSGSQGAQTAKILTRYEEWLAGVQPRPRATLVVGDVNSTLACGLASVKLGVPLIHVEAGLRSFDRTMPEEVNRVLVDQVSDLLFTHSPEAEVNLAAEGIDADRVRFVGNTMIDSLVALEDRFRELRACREHGLEPGSYLLVTLHRPALVDGPLLGPAIDRLGEIAASTPVLFPVHPRTRAELAKQAVELPSGLNLIDPVGYLDFLSLEADAKAVLTDSGGIQEETTYLGVPCFTLRDNTERPVTVEGGTNRVLGLDPARIAEIPGLLAGSCDPPTEPPHGWDGHAGERLAAVVAGYLGG